MRIEQALAWLAILYHLFSILGFFIRILARPPGRPDHSADLDWEGRCKRYCKTCATINLNYRPTVVVGIMQPGFDFPHPAVRSDFPHIELWVPLGLDSQKVSFWNYSVTGRLRPGVTAAGAQREIAALSNDFFREHNFPKEGDTGAIAVVVPLSQKIIGGVRTQLLMLFGAVGFVLLIACSLVIHGEHNPEMLIAAVRREVSALDPELPLYEVETLDQAMARSLSTKRLTNLLLAAFAATALLLAALGIYGVMSLNVSSRIIEFGIRLALGAQPRDVLRLVISQGMRLAFSGVALGLAGAFVLTRFLASLLFGVSSTDPTTFGLVALLLTGVALLACYVPARRATRVDPMVALRYE